MNHVISQDQLTEVEGKRTVDASDLGLPPGIWPETITIKETEVPYRLTKKIWGQPGDLLGIEYQSPEGQILGVFND